MTREGLVSPRPENKTTRGLTESGPLSLRFLVIEDSMGYVESVVVAR